jgi:hypothetical protein
MAVVYGKGTVVKNGTTTITQVFDIKPPQLSNPSIDTTDLSSANRKKAPTICDYGTFQIKINYDPGDATHAALYAAWVAGTALTMNVELNDAGDAVLACPSYIEGWDWGNLTVDNKSEATVTFCLTDLITLTP